MTIKRWLCVLALLLLGACGGTVEYRWKEEVLLHDGSSIWVDRHIEAHASGFPNSHEGSTIMEEFRYPPLGVEWKAVWSAARPVEHPVAFDVIGKSAFLIVTTGNRRMVCTPETPSGTYTANYYVWNGGKIKKVAQNQVPLENMRFNVGGNYRNQPGLPSQTRISWAQKVTQAGENFTNLQSIEAYFSRRDLALRCP